MRETVTVVRVHEPDESRTPHYLARYHEYQRLVDVMRQPWDELHKLE